MILPVNYEIAKVQLLARKKQSLVAMLGVTFGIAMFILLISFMTGVNEWTEEVMLGSTPDIHIYNDIKTDLTNSISKELFGKIDNIYVVHHPKPKNVNNNIKNADHIISVLNKDPDIYAVSPMLSTQVFYNYGPVQINGLINGIKIKEETKLMDLSKKMVAGKTDNLLTTDNGIIMGIGLAKKLNVGMGDLVTLSTPLGTSVRLRIVGIYQIGLNAIDDIRSYVNLPIVQQVLGKNKNYITDINIKLRDSKIAMEKAKIYGKQIDYKCEDWQSANASIQASIGIRDLMTYVVSFAMLLVAGFGIYNIMNMLIVSKMKDIAILKAQGFASRDITTIFLSQSLAIGIAGALTGIILGFICSYMMSRVEYPDNPYVYLKYMPVAFKFHHYLIGVVFGIVTTFAAGILPSMKASKVDSVDILRG